MRLINFVAGNFHVEGLIEETWLNWGERWRRREERGERTCLFSSRLELTFFPGGGGVVRNQGKRGMSLSHIS